VAGDIADGREHGPGIVGLDVDDPQTRRGSGEEGVLLPSAGQEGDPVGAIEQPFNHDPAGAGRVALDEDEVAHAGSSVSRPSSLDSSEVLLASGVA
jgi:hypothetical protein